MAMAPRKIWYLNGDGERLNVNEAFGLFKIDSITTDMMQIVEMGMRMGEESTSIPLVTQGQSGPTTPDTFGATQLQNNNANQLLRSIGYTFDDHVTEPETRQYYEWLILDPDVPNDEKGDWTIDAHGSSALVERSLQDQTVAQILPLANTAPAFGLSPKRTMEMYLRSKNLEPKDFQYTEAEQAKIDAQPPPAAPAIEAAKINAASREKIAAQASALDAKQLEVDHQEVLSNATVELHTLALKKELAMLEYANKNQISLNQVKADLAQTAMKLRTEEKLNATNQAVDLHMHHNPPPAPAAKPRPQRPAVQVPGRARNGQAASQVT